MDAPIMPQTDFQQQALSAARAGVEFFIRHQCVDATDANHGRYLWAYDLSDQRIMQYSTNWSGAVVIQAILAGYQVTGEAAWLESARRAIEYTKTLQILDPSNPRLDGVIREETPQTLFCCPRDGLTAAWAMLDWHRVSGDADSLARSRRYADWFCRVGLERGFPYWTIRIDDKPWVPVWSGSFHSGSAVFLGKLYEQTGDAKYLAAMRQVIDHYNRVHLKDDGSIHVICDPDGTSRTDIRNDEAPWEWQVMHQYNDDFGCLGNLVAHKITGESQYLEAAGRFLRFVTASQRPDGGFGPADAPVPSAAGSVLIEYSAAKTVGLDFDFAPSISNAVRYLHSIQRRNPARPDDGAFVDTEKVVLARTGAYAITALYHVAAERRPDVLSV